MLLILVSYWPRFLLHLGIEFGSSTLRKIFTSKLPQDAKEAQIKEHFGQFGAIETVTLKTDMATGSSRGFCFIVYKSVNSLEEVVAAEHTFSKKKVAVKKAQAKGTIYLFIYILS